jgi:hypothetical protein
MKRKVLNVFKPIKKLGKPLVMTGLTALYVALAANVSLGNTHEISKAAGVVRGTVSFIIGDHAVPASRVRLTFSGKTGDEFEIATNAEGKYELPLPAGSYSILLHWYGDCSRVRRAPFKLEEKENLTFDFLLVSCRIVDTETRGETSPPRVQDDVGLTIPLDVQSPEYREQVIPAGEGGQPEILVSFGKYDNQADYIRYFSLDNQIIKNLSVNPIIPLPLPVTVTVDRYTIRASTVVWHKKAMTFDFVGDVSVSDGHVTGSRDSAILYFRNGVPTVRTDSAK